MRVVSVTADLIGDGEDGYTVSGDDVRGLIGLRLQPSKAGSFSWQVRAVDVCGGQDATGVARPIEVR